MDKKADKRISGLIVMLAGLLLLIFAIREQTGMPQSLAAARNAAYVSDGQVLAENEGRLVIVTGTLVQEGDTVDELLGLHFDVPVLYRVVEEYTLDTTVGDGTWSWEKRYSDVAGELACDTIAGNVKLGSFTLAEDILSAFPTDTVYDRFSEDELTQAGLHAESNYITRDTGVNRGTSTTLLGLFGDGDVRISYRCFDTAENPTVTLIAYQNGNTLTQANFEEVSFSSVMPGTLSKEEFLSAASEDLTQDNLLIALAAAALLLYGGYRFGKYYRKRKEN